MSDPVDHDRIELIEVSDDEKAQLMRMVSDAQQTRSEIKQTRMDLAIKGVFMQSQVDWIRDQSDVRIWEKSRRIGCTWACAAEAVIEAARANRGMNQFYMGYNLGMAAEFIGDCAMWCRAFGVVMDAIQVSREAHFVAKERKDITLYRIRFSNGNVIEALSSNPLNWRGRDGHARIDEAGHMKDLKSTVDAAMAWLLWGGRVSVTGTHNTDESEFLAMIKDCKAGLLDYKIHYTDFDQAIEEGFFRRVAIKTGKTWSDEAEREFRDKAFRRYTDQERANEELLCIPRRSQGEYMSRMLLEYASHKDVPVIKWEQSDSFVTQPDRIRIAEQWFDLWLLPLLTALPRDQRSVYGQDFARSADISGIKIAQEIGIRQWIPRCVIELRNIPYDIQEHLAKRILESLPRLKRAKFDARGNGGALAEKCKQLPSVGYSVDAVMVSESFYAEKLPKYRAALQAREFLIAANEDVIEDHRTIQLVKGNPKFVGKRAKGVDGKMRHGDSAVSSFMTYLATEDNIQAPAGGQVAAEPGTYSKPRPGTEHRTPLIEREKRPGSGLVGRVRGFIARTWQSRL
jgi:phage FluMu gp28-like protein